MTELETKTVEVIELEQKNEIVPRGYSSLQKLDLSEIEKLSKEELRELISFVEMKMKESPNQIAIPVKEYFSEGVYAREITMPKGSLVVGKIHKFRNLNIMTKGELTMISIDGVKKLKAPCTVVSSPGVKRLSFTNEETTWTTILGTSETDSEKIESHFIAKNYDEVIELEESNKIDSEVKPCLS